MSTYVLDQGFPGERERLEAMARSWDPGTLRLVTDCGIGPGQRCLEVGAGTGTVSRALAELVGPDGQVVALDRDVRFLDDQPANVEVCQADLMTDDLPRAAFDLVHARLLVAHLHPHRDAIARLADAVAPGGWLLVEDVDWTFVDLTVPSAPVHSAMMVALRRILGQGGFDATYGRHLYTDMRSLGLTEVTAEYRGNQTPSSNQSWLAWQLLVTQFEEDMVDTGLLSRRQVEDWWALSRAGTGSVVSATMFAVRARRA
ncbi:class I SAM-dependent methyltransferase [Amycolatopsis pigmentata]|uniref:Class I SAM-dependent methyltransferase n=1 Tax=Amycolatopsis pigmentata TaxID=450801 RepID=A0ABW5G2B3_9PSEU